MILITKHNTRYTSNDTQIVRNPRKHNSYFGNQSIDTHIHASNMGFGMILQQGLHENRFSEFQLSKKSIY